MPKLDKSFYLDPDVNQVARNLLGKRLVTHLEGVECSGLISETEAYNGVVDRASHAFGGRRTKRTETMYLEGGVCYIYLCYGIHHLFNVVTNVEGIPHAVLLRAMFPEKGMEWMMERRGHPKEQVLSAGPGTLSQALGLHTRYDGTSLLGETIWIEDAGILVPDKEVSIGPRIGVGYAKEDALLPYRYVWKRPWTIDHGPWTMDDSEIMR